MCTKTHNYEVQFLRYGVRDRIFSHFGLFLPFYPPNNPENQNFEKMKKESGDDIILHMCTKITIIMYASWNMKCNWHIFFFLSFWAIFCSYTLLKWTINKNHVVWFLRYEAGHCLLFHSYNPKNQKFEKMKKNTWSYHHFTSLLKIICYVPKIWCMADVIMFHFGLFFALLPH